MVAKKKKTTKRKPDSMSANTIIADGREYLLIDEYTLQVSSADIYENGVIINFESPLFEKSLAIMIPHKTGLDLAKNLEQAVLATHADSCDGCDDLELHGKQPIATGVLN